jgi:hypothetical protein
MSGWVLTAQLQAFRRQMDAVFPDRDRRSDGTVGDVAHQAETSGHNPDRSANAEYSDGDARDEVRALDVDADTGNPDVSMEDVVQHLVTLARSGKLWFIRYMIYNRRIWTANDGWRQRAYTGASPHTEHLHLSGAYDQASDELATANYHLDELVDTVSKQDVIDALRSAAGQEALTAWLRTVDGRRAAYDAVLGTETGRDPKTGSVVFPGIVNPGDPAYDPKLPATVKTGVGTMSLATAINRLVVRADAERAEVPPTSDQTAQAVVAGLTAGTAAETAELLQVILGVRAAEVGRLLATPPPVS